MLETNRDDEWADLVGSARGSGSDTGSGLSLGESPVTPAGAGNQGGVVPDRGELPVTPAGAGNQAPVVPHRWIAKEAVGGPDRTGDAAPETAPELGAAGAGGDPKAAAGSPARKSLRGDIQGLRAIAVLMVLLYHAGLPFVPGGFAGVDVFFVISGFLITGLMVREQERTGGLSLRNFWARRAKRLLPATALVLLAVTVLSLLLMPQLRWISTAGDVVAAALYAINWRLAGQSIDYLAQDYAPSPVQHFWSLAVEEQFYLVWPLLVVGISWLARRVGWPLRRALIVGLAALAVPSLIYSIAISHSDPAAYFVTTTRAWELGIGAAAAVLATRLNRMNAGFAVALTWAGVAVLAGVALVLKDSVTWPGSAALLPTLATAAVIAGGPAAGPRGATWLIGRAPMRWIGDLSYSLYLWHWPLVVFATLHWGGLTVRHGLLVVALSIVPAWLTYTFLESPLHLSARLARFPGRALALGAACTVLGIAAGVGLRVAIPDVSAVSAADRPGALALLTDPKHAIDADRAASITPDPLKARDDLPDLYARKCQSNYAQAVPTPCEFGDPAGRVTVALVGDSRAAQWAPAVQELARTQGWRVITITKAGCAFGDVQIVKGRPGKELPYTSCTQWNAAVTRLLTTPGGRYHPDFVITSAFSPYASSVDGVVQKGPANQAALIAGFRRTWIALNRAGVPVVALRETPYMAKDVAECVSANRDNLSACSRLRDRAMTPAHIMQPAGKGLLSSGTAVIDLTLKAVCPAVHCPVVIGNVLVYRDSHHLTATYSRSLAPFLSAALAQLRTKDFDGGKLDAILPRS